MESQGRRKSMRSSTTAEVRRTSRRFFGRSSSSVLRPSKPLPPEEDASRRRSFLSKPPTPGAARRVLAVLNHSQKRSPASPRKTQSSHPAIVSGTGYEDFDDQPIQLRTRHSHHTTPQSPVWNHAPPSPLQKPIAPSRHVRPLNDTADPVRSESMTSSMPSSHPSARGQLQKVIMEVEASEVSDDIQSNTDPKSRSGRFSGSTTRSPGRQSPPNTQDLDFIDDMPDQGVRFKSVGAEEDYVPLAPTDANTQFSNKMDVVQSWASFEERIRALQSQVNEEREGRLAAERTSDDLVVRNKELEVLVNSFRTRTAESNAEVEELTRHLKETRKRLNRRIRDLEDELSSEKSRNADEIAKYRGMENPHRANVKLSHGNMKAAPVAGNAPALPSRRRRARPLTPSSTMRDVNTRPLAEGVAGQHIPHPHFARVHTTGNVHEHLRGKSLRGDSFSSVHRPGTPNRKPYQSEVARDDMSPRTLARRSLIHRALVAHIHSSRYRSAKNAWYEFLQAEAGTVTPDQFARAVRGLAVAADAYDRDLDLLRQEVCGAEDCDTGVLSWEMFFRFYQSTRNVRT